MSLVFRRPPRSFSMNHMDHVDGSNDSCLHPCKHHPVTPKYPTGNVTAHLPDLAAFVNIVAEGLSKVAFPRPQHHYSSVHVLLISWEHDDLNTEHDIGKLKTLFTDTYRYTVDPYQIPSSNDPYTALEFRLVQAKLKANETPDSLLIIYYGGHGEINKRDQHIIWKAWKTWRPGFAQYSPSLDWTELQGSIMKAKADVLFILDCCYAGGAVQGFYPGRREMLLASCKTEKASNENTFTKALVQEIELLHGHTCPVATLHGLLVQHRELYRLDPCPMWTCVGKEPAGITLVPQPVAPNVPISGTIPTGQPSGRPLTTQAILEAQCRVLISVSLTSVGPESLPDTWINWIKDHAPSNVSAVSVGLVIRTESIFVSNSAYMIVSVPVAVWNAMASHPAIQFLALVRSPNLLGQNPGATIKPEVTTGTSKESEKVAQWIHNTPRRTEISQNPVDSLRGEAAVIDTTTSPRLPSTSAEEIAGPLATQPGYVSAGTQRLPGVPANVSVELEDVSRLQRGPLQGSSTSSGQPARQLENLSKPVPPGTASSTSPKSAYRLDHRVPVHGTSSIGTSRRFIVCCDGEATEQGNVQSNVTRFANAVAGLDDHQNVLQIVYRDGEPPPSWSVDSERISTGLILFPLALFGTAFYAYVRLCRSVLGLAHGRLTNTNTMARITPTASTMLRSFDLPAYYGSRRHQLLRRIREIYRFLAYNVDHVHTIDQPDTLFLIGSSSGCVVALQVAEVVCSIGLPTKTGLSYLDDIMHDWECKDSAAKPILFAKLSDHAQIAKDYQESDHCHNIQWRLKQRAAESACDIPNGEARRIYVEDLGRYLEEHGLTTKSIWINSLGLFDGLPQSMDYVKQYSAKPAPRILGGNLRLANIFQAFALDETRSSLAPIELKSEGAESSGPFQVWFPGRHEDLVGTSQQRGISDQALAWMMDRLSGEEEAEGYQQKRNRIKFNDDAAKALFATPGISQNERGGKRLASVPIRSVLTVPQLLAGHSTRHPTTAKEYLMRSCQYAHPSIRMRMDHGGTEPAANWSQVFPWSGWDIAPYFDLPKLCLYRMLRKPFPKPSPYHPNRVGGPLQDWKLKRGPEMPEHDEGMPADGRWSWVHGEGIMEESSIGNYEQMLLLERKPAGL
ncbi:hypothetical protein LTR17_024299 [Elasticomyces elasticus]|nr:hypothetical protein LTR17_024299 [Elasticomyces elasticus]